MSNSTNVNNVIATLLGQVDEEKLIKITTDSGAPIGNFEKIKDIANNIDENSNDIRASWKDVRVQHTDYFDSLNPGNLVLSVFGKDYKFSGNGITALCNLLTIPTQYVKKCMAQGNFGLACLNLNTWIDKMPQDKEMLLRTTNSRLFGIVSNKYTIFDDSEVLDVVEGILGPQNNYSIKDYSISPELMKLRIVSRDKIIINGEELSFGFDVKNSRVGRSSVSIDVLIYRAICSNGMIFGGSKGMMYTKRHVAIERGSLVTEFTEMLDQAPDTIEFIKKHIEESQLSVAKAGVITSLLSKFKTENIPKNALIRLEQSISENSNVTLWDFANQVTSMAQEYSIETRERMEVFAGKIILNQIA